MGSLVSGPPSAKSRFNRLLVAEMADVSVQGVPALIHADWSAFGSS